MEPNENKFSRENMNEFIDEKLNPEDSSFDDFDLEALEGLKMAGKIENDLFNRIDSKIDQEVVRRSKKRIGIVWMSIAACLALAIGFYFWSTLNLSQIETQKIGRAHV